MSYYRCLCNMPATLRKAATATGLGELAISKRDSKPALMELHKSLSTKIAVMESEAKVPKGTPVQITDAAVPGRAPVRPNKTLNIVLGAAAGIFLAGAAGAIGALLVFFGKRKAALNLPRTDIPNPSP